MKTALIAFALLVVVNVTECLAQGSGNNPNPASPGSIKVSNVAPSGLVTGGQKNNVTADVAVTGLADGLYDVVIVVWDYNAAGNSSKRTVGTVGILNGKGTVSISSDFPAPAASGDTGIVQVQVTDPSSGSADSDQSSIKYQ